MEVNGELESLEAALAQAMNVLGPGGRLVVLSYHSLEERTGEAHAERGGPKRRPRYVRPSGPGRTPARAAGGHEKARTSLPGRGLP